MKCLFSKKTQQKLKPMHDNASKNLVCGFTLIELMVVVSIIALLASVVLTSLNDARAKARDATRLSDMKNIQLALELYASENGGVYPSSEDDPAMDCYTDSDFEDVMKESLVKAGYLPVVPHDPSDSATNYPLCYVYESPVEDTGPSCGSNTNPAYILHFSVESVANPEKGKPFDLELSDYFLSDYCLTNEL